MVDRDYFKEYYENHRDRIRAQTRERVARWHKNHHQEFLASRRTEEYRKKRRKTLLHYVNLYFSKYGSSIDISDLWPSLRKYANRPLREIVKGKKEREFLNVTQYSLRRKEDKPIIAYFLLERYKNKGYKNDKNKKASSFIISLLGESPIETLKNYEEKLRSNIKGVYSKASKEKADKIFNENVEEYRKRYDKCSNFVREEYHKIADSTEEKYDKIVDPAKERYDKTVASAEEKYNKIIEPAWEKSKREDGYYRCPISDCNAKFKHLEKLKQHYFVRHGEGIKFILYLFEDKVNKLYLK